MLILIITVLVVGIMAGAVARAVIRQDQKISIKVTILLGVVGAFLGGFPAFLILHRQQPLLMFQPWSTVGAILGAAIVLLLWLTLGTRKA